MSERLNGYVVRGEIPGMVTAISRHGEVHIETVGTMAMGGSAPVRTDSIFRIASMTKPIAAVAALTLVEDGVIGLDDPVHDFLPELANRRVLLRPDGPLDETKAAGRPITLRDVLTFRLGFGMSPEVPLTAPIMGAAAEREIGIAPPKTQRQLSVDEWLFRLGELPLMFQPGSHWAYHTSATVMGALIERASGQGLETYLRDRIFEPLHMHDTSFFVPESKRERLVTGYGAGTTIFDDPADSAWAQPAPFPDAGGDLVSTVTDYLAFAQMLESGGTGILTGSSVTAMTTDQLSLSQATFEPELGWGFGLSVTRAGKHAGEYGWSGGLGTVWFNDPAEDLIAILLTQRAWESPQPPPVVADFVKEAYAE